MQSTIIAACLEPLTGPERRALLHNSNLHTLQGVFTHVSDPRSHHGRRYPLPFLLTCLVAALLCGCNSLEAVGQWCAEHPELLCQMFGPQRHFRPTGALYRWLLPQLSADEIEWVLASWVQATRTFWDREPLLIDGKVVRGAQTATTKWVDT